MATSPTDICNIALTWLSANPIASIDDTSIEGKICKANYDFTRRSVLEEREWTFALKRAQLNLLVDPPAFGYSYQFSLPPDFLRSVQAYYSPDECAEPILHIIEDNRLLTNEDTVYLRYIYDNTNPELYSDFFIQAVAAKLASVMAMPITANAELQLCMLQIYQDHLNRATSSDALQGSRERLRRSQMELSRRHFVGFD